MASNAVQRQTGPENEKQSDVKAEGTKPAGASTSVEHTEPEDAYLTGGQRNLQRRVLGLNVEGNAPQAQGHPEKPAGIHSTGSFTGTAEKPEEPSE